MEPHGESSVSSGRSRFPGGLKDVKVHVLSEHVFCPRAAVLAHESGEDCGDEEPLLGPRLDGLADYDEHRFVEELRKAWSDLYFWLTLVAPGLLLILVVWRLVSPLWAVAVSLPLCYFAARSWDAGMRIVRLVREQALFAAAASMRLDLESDEIRPINWWSLRKAGFDCRKPVDPHRDPEEHLAGKPWRMLTKDTTLRIPVVRKHRGERTWGRQHIVRIAAYCHLIQVCEQAKAPFGVLMFAGSYDCVLIPNSAATQFEFRNALEEATEFLRICEQGAFVPAEPTDNRCRGCHQGKPRLYVAGESETVLNGQPLEAFVTRAKNNKLYHCTCGDRFHNVPAHDDSVRLGIARARL